MKRLARVIIFGASIAAMGCNGNKPAEQTSPGTTKTPTETTPKAPTPPVENGHDDSGPKLKALDIKDVKVGTGPAVETGDIINVLYEGKLANGKVFDGNLKEKPPLGLVIGQHSVIEGWEKGFLGMKAGGERKLGIPYAMGYGDTGRDPIPPKADLFFDVKLLGLVKQGDSSTVKRTYLKKGSGRVAKKGDLITIKLEGRLLNGQVFETRAVTGAQTFQLGGNRALAGIESGLEGVPQGSSVRLTIPPDIGYGPDGGANGKIPPYAIVVFDIDVTKVESGS